MKKNKEESPRHTIIITLGEMEKKDSSIGDDDIDEGEEGGDIGDKIVKRMIKKNKKKGGKC